MGAWQRRIWAKLNAAHPRHLELLHRMLCSNPEDRLLARELVQCVQEVPATRPTLEVLTTTLK